ncbi:hypothetical protein [Arenicella sp. 4NH20-0111]
MNHCLVIVVAFILLFSSSARSSCDFEFVIDQFKVENAKSDAKNSFKPNGKNKAYGVANGIGPERPGIDSLVIDTNMLICYMDAFEWELLWVGGDVLGTCNDRKSTESHALAYAKAYNEELIRLLKANNQDVCDKKS